MISTSQNYVNGMVIYENGHTDGTSAQTRDFTGWKFDSSTRFSVCSDLMTGTPHAYCEILGITTWYAFTDPIPAPFLIGGFYRNFLLDLELESHLFSKRN